MGSSIEIRWKRKPRKFTACLVKIRNNVKSQRRICDEIFKNRAKGTFRLYLAEVWQCRLTAKNQENNTFQSAVCYLRLRWKQACICLQNGRGRGISRKASALSVWNRHIFPSFNHVDLLAGISVAALMKMILYMKSKNKKKFRQGEEYGSAVWRTEKAHTAVRHWRAYPSS